MEPESLALAADFPAATREDWRALVAAVLAKSGVAAAGDAQVDALAGLEQALTHTTYDGIPIRPLYTADDAPGLADAGEPGAPPFVRGATAQGPTVRGWDVRTRHAGPDAAATNRAVLGDLETGATSLWLVLGEGGLPIADLDGALAGVYLDLAPVVLDAGREWTRAALALLNLAEQRGVDPAELAGSFGADPIGCYARTGAPADLTALLSLVEQSRGPNLRLATVDGTVYHDAGGSDAQELGIATAVGVAYLRTLVDGGVAVDAALDAIEFRWAVTAEQFPSIAKLRAARRIWHRVAEASGASPERRGQYQHAVTSAAMLTRRDPWVNMLRTTIGCFAAAVGGADAITVTPFDAAIGQSDDFARRIARNTQSILHDESSLGRVIDAAGGSWFVESFTEQLAEKAWDVFRAVERAGGALKALEDGVVREWLAATQEQRAADIAHRRAPITGVSEFAFIDEAPVARPEATRGPDAGPLRRLRYAQPFEALRDRADAAPVRPRVFLATLGPPAAHSARQAFAANLFQAGGIECVSGPVERFDAAETPVACICSSDRIYADEAAPAAAALKAAGARHVWLAGRVEAPGVDGNLYAGGDALAVLTTTLAALGGPA